MTINGHRTAVVRVNHDESLPRVHIILKLRTSSWPGLQLELDKAAVNHYAHAPSPVV
jgi:hypothetical protein